MNTNFSDQTMRSSTILCIGLVTVSLTSCGGSSSGPDNTAPQIQAPSSVTVLENLTAVATVTLADAEQDSVTLSIDPTSADGELFQITSGTSITFKAAPDFENPQDAVANNRYEISLLASDGALQTTHAMVVDVSNAFEGRVIDGPLSGSEFFVDLNGNGTQDDDEPNGVTDNDGYFSIPMFSITTDSNRMLISRGGIDQSTGVITPHAILTHRVASGDETEFTVVTPVSTVLSWIASKDDRNRILSALGLPSDENSIKSIDSWAMSQEQDAIAQGLQKQNLQIGLVLLSALNVAALNIGDETGSLAVVEDLALELLAALPSVDTLNLADQEIVRKVFGSTASTHLSLDQTAAQSVADSISSLNGLVAHQALPPTSAHAISIARKAQEDLMVQVNLLASRETTAEQFLANSSAQALMSEVTVGEDETNADDDTLIDVFDPDDDNDGVLDGVDAFPLDDTESVDTDNDGVGNNADTDDDNDGVADVSDAFPLDSAESIDTDGDGIGNNADTDDDGDGVADTADAFPLDENETLDTDADGIGNNADTDDDGDGVADTADAFPLDEDETLDTDADGIGNNADTDDDGDSISDVDEGENGTNPLLADTDGDGVNDNLDEAPLSKDVNVLPVAKAQSLELDLLPSGQTSLPGTLTATSQDSRAVTYSIVSQPTLGTVVFEDTAEGKFIYQTKITTKAQGNDSFTFKVNDGFIDSANAQVSVAVKSDPLYEHIWHLDNTGQANYADSGGTAGEDLNVDTVISSGIRGLGVIVAVLDSGLEIGHPDLAPNVIADGSYNYLNSDTDPTSLGTTGDHGTSVAGIIAADGWNNIGVRGVAPEASLKGFNVLQVGTTSNFIDALGGGSTASSDDVSVFNLSYGLDTTIAALVSPTIEAQFKSGTTSLRSGKGAVYVKSSGNGFSSFRDTTNTVITCPFAAAEGLSCQNTAQDPQHVLPYVISVAALNADGTKSSYSTHGATNWISAPGGEYGNNQNFTGSGTGTPAIMTVDQSSCSQGYVSTLASSLNAFDDKGNHTTNSNCDYTSTFNGTSSSAPNVSGVVALMLEANPDLTWRDVKHILASTARQVDASRAAVSLSGVIVEPAWITNDAGFKFHNAYGFGAIDAAAAVSAASTFLPNSLGAQVERTFNSTAALAFTVDDLTQSNVRITFTDSGTVEFLRIKFDIDHGSPRDMTIAVVSPNETRSVLQHVYNSYTDWSSDFELGSSAFYGEELNGEWAIEFTDHVDNGNTMTLNQVQMTIYAR